MQIFFFCFFQGFSSFSLLGLRRSLAIQWRLLLWTAHTDRHVRVPVRLPGAAALAFDLRGGPLQAGPYLLGLDLDLRALLSLRRLPRVRAEPANYDHARALGQGLG